MTRTALRRNAAQSNTSQTARPPIWVGGRQQPKFAVLPWVTVGHAMARLWLVPHLAAGSERLVRLGSQIDTGRFAVNLSRLGKVAHHFPSRRAVAETVTGLAMRIADARMILDPVPQMPQALPDPGMIRTANTADSGASAATVSPCPAAPSALRSDATHLEPTLSAIRAIMRSQSPAEPATAPHPRTHGADLRKKEAEKGRLGQFLARGLSHVIAWSTLALAMPVGLVRAALFHLNGGDLADWD